MSSTAVVLKCLMDHRSQHTVHGQVMLGVLILQDCALGLILAIIPNLTLNQCEPPPRHPHFDWLLLCTVTSPTPPSSSECAATAL